MVVATIMQVLQREVLRVFGTLVTVAADMVVLNPQAVLEEAGVRERVNQEALGRVGMRCMQEVVAVAGTTAVVVPEAQRDMVMAAVAVQATRADLPFRVHQMSQEVVKLQVELVMQTTPVVQAREVQQDTVLAGAERETMGGWLFIDRMEA